MITPALIFNNDVDLTQRVFAFAFGLQVVVDHFQVQFGDAMNSLERGFDRAVAGGGFREGFFTGSQTNSGTGDMAGMGAGT